MLGIFKSQVGGARRLYEPKPRTGSGHLAASFSPKYLLGVPSAANSSRFGAWDHTMRTEFQVCLPKA